jgi:hypothetical protein
MGATLVIKDSMIGTKDLKVKILNNIVELRTDQLLLANTEIQKLKADNKKLIRKVWIYKIAGVTGIVLTAIILR